MLMDIIYRVGSMPIPKPVYLHCKQTMVIQTKKNTSNFGMNAHNLIMYGYTKVIRSFVVCITIVCLQSSFLPMLHPVDGDSTND